MQPWTITLIVLCVVFFDVVIVFGLVIPAVVRGNWGPMAARFPGRPAAPGAVRREFQSFRFGVLNLGWCVHVEVDETCLHLRPAMLARRWGCVDVSVPWEEVRPTGARRGGMRPARIGATSMWGPSWCLDLAEEGGGAAG